MLQSGDEIELGAYYRDIVTGFGGTAVSVTRYLTGCDRVWLERQTPAADREPKGQAFDVVQVKWDGPPSPEVQDMKKRLADGADRAQRKELDHREAFRKAEEEARSSRPSEPPVDPAPDPKVGIVGGPRGTAEKPRTTRRTS